MPTVYMPGGHVDMHYHVAQPQQPVKPPSSRGSHSSDTSSAYSGSDTMQVRTKLTQIILSLGSVKISVKIGVRC